MQPNTETDAGRNNPDKPSPHEIRYKVDGEPQITTERELTPVEIMKNAGVDPLTHYLIELQGNNKQHSFKDTPDEPIKMHNNLEFITAALGPTTVS